MADPGFSGDGIFEDPEAAFGRSKDAVGVMRCLGTCDNGNLAVRRDLLDLTGRGNNNPDIAGIVGAQAFDRFGFDPNGTLRAIVARDYVLESTIGGMPVYRRNE